MLLPDVNETSLSAESPPVIKAIFKSKKLLKL
jgi:hypothetical protein